jgi:hypothetical protein
VVVQKAIASGIRNADKLANIPFFLHHQERLGGPDMVGLAISKNEPDYRHLADEWLWWRDLVRGMLKTKPAQLSSTGPATDSDGYSRIFQLASRAELFGVPRGFAKYALIQATTESRGNRLVGLGIPERFPSWAKPNRQASSKAQRLESRAAEGLYDRNVRHYGISPHPREEWVFGSGGWFGFLPATGLAAFINTPLIASGEVYPYMVFEESPSIVMLAAFVRRLVKHHFKNLPHTHRNWLAIKRAGAGLGYIGDYLEKRSRSIQIREKAERSAQQRNISSSFLKEGVPLEWTGYPGAVELLRAAGA